MDSEHQSTLPDRGLLTALQQTVLDAVYEQLKTEPWFPSVASIPTGLPSDEEIKRHGKSYWIKKLIREMQACYHDFEVE